MQDTVTTSWRRLGDTLRNGADSASAPSARVLPLHVKEAQRLEACQHRHRQQRSAPHGCRTLSDITLEILTCVPI